MAYINRDIDCCGLREIGGLSEGRSPEANMQMLVQDMYQDIQPDLKKIEAEVDASLPPGKEWIEDYPGGEKYYIAMSGSYKYRIYRYDLIEQRLCNEHPNHYNLDGDDHKWRYAVFTQAGSNATYGKRFAAFIEENKLGEVVQATTKTVRNPNSGNILKAWIWTVNHKNLRNWAKKNL